MVNGYVRLRSDERVVSGLMAAVWLMVPILAWEALPNAWLSAAVAALVAPKASLRCYEAATGRSPQVYWFKGLNLRIGRLSDLLAPGYGHCDRCRTNWYFVQPRPVRVTDRYGAFTLCQKCWNETTVKERLAYHEAAYRAHWRDAGHFSLEQLREAVMAAR